MVRCVAYRKAITAGALGAIAWEVMFRGLSAAGVRLYDLVFLIGTMRGEQPPWIWWPTGMALHTLVGTIWAIFYAYFFWSTLDRPPIVQGLAFAVIPAVLAGLVMVPQIGWMHLGALTYQLEQPGVFAIHYGWEGPAGILAGHAVYGAVMGALYTRPVGYPTGTKPRLVYE